MAMYEVYFDDSGTDTESPMAIAACYISTKNGWNQFVDRWDEIRANEGFDAFHMTDFAAYHDKTKTPWCDWDYIKRQRVYGRLAKVINESKRIGIAVAIPRPVFEAVVPELPEWMRWRVGQYPYTTAVRFLMGAIRNWRMRYGITLPMQYIFDPMTDPLAKAEITVMWEKIANPETWFQWYGIEDAGGYSFQSRAKFKPLQAADILAWQHNSHMRNVIMKGLDEYQHTHANFRILREDQEMDLGFLTEAQFREAMQKEMAFRIEHGQTETEF